MRNAGAGAGGGVGRVYAEALFALAKEKGEIDSVRADLSQIRSILRDNPEFKSLLESPERSRDETERIARETIGRIAGPHVVNLVLLLIRKRRQFALTRVIDGFEGLCEEERNERRATIETAVALDAAERARIVTALSAKTGAQIVLDERVDPALLGGLRLRIGDTLLDGTIKSGLERLARHMEHPNHDEGAA